MSRDDKLPSKARDRTPERATSERGEIDAFLNKVRAIQPSRPGGGGRGRLVFALDATASRQPTWDRAMHTQADMFKETQILGGLDIQLVFYRGYGECKSSKWYSQADQLLRAMTGVTCLAGRTQIRKVLKHARDETQTRKVNALVFVGDAMEEDPDELGHLAGELGLLGVPCFLFHEGGDPLVRSVFEQIAKLSGGACCAFDAQAPQQLRDLLSAVAVYAAGGHKALADFSAKRGGVTRLLTNQVR